MSLLPAVSAAWLTLLSVYEAGRLLWTVAGTVLPPAIRGRPADVAFWLLFTAAIIAPFWR